MLLVVTSTTSTPFSVTTRTTTWWPSPPSKSPALTTACIRRNSPARLTNTRAVILILGALNLSNMIIMRTYFKNNIPEELFEAAKLDGISDFGYFTKIVLPLSKPVLAVILLYCIVAHWNSYFIPLIYLNDRELFPLQLVLREILNASRVDASQIADSEVLAGIANSVEVMKYALVVVSTVPMLILYPFVQKFFKKGIMIGSLKG